SRTHDIDAAILRRMPKRYAVSLPNHAQRLNILSLILKDTPLAPAMTALAELSSGQSGSDLREICRDAAMVPVREYMRGTKGDKELLALGQLEVRCHLAHSSFAVADPSDRLRDSTSGRSRWKTSLHS
ncbi:hypothetical protein B0H10DRAFT_1784952, partial [Mycena sp. CBHHK59/15]